MADPKIAIVGAGPIGGILGAHLQKVGFDVLLVDILKDHLNTCRDDGLEIKGVHEFKVKCPHICYDVAELEKWPSVETVVIGLKASVMKFVLPKMTLPRKDVKFISLQNGLDTEDYIAETYGKENTARIVVNYAGGLKADGQIWMAFFNEPNYIGVLDNEAKPWAEALAKELSNADLKTEFTDEIKKHEWEKTILNAALSPVCALTRKTMKEMMDFDDTEFLVEEILREGIMVAEAHGITYDEGFFDHCVGYLKKAGYHQTSMHVDVERGSPTEIGFLNEKIVEKGREKNIPTPYNLTITALIKGLEMKSTAPEQ